MKRRALRLVPGLRRRLLLTALGGIVAGPLAAGESEKGRVMDFSDPDVARRSQLPMPFRCLGAASPSVQRS